MITSSASAQLRVVSYNMLDKPTNMSDTAMIEQVRTVYGAIATDSINGIAKRPDLIVLTEQTTTSPTNLVSILNNLWGVSSYFAVTPSPQGFYDRVSFVYDSAALNVTSAPIALPIDNAAYPRPTIRIGVQPTGYTSDNATVYVYGMHTKASDTSADAEQRRLQIAAARANADSLGPNKNIVFAGDLNLYRASEGGYSAMLAAGDGQLKDPLGASAAGNWNNNSAFASMHTQSTRASVSLPDGGVTGGMDDRFDFQMVSNVMLGGEGISYIGPTSAGSTAAASYRAFGNDGSVFNRNVNDSRNTSKPAAVLDALFNLSDHLPVVADYQVPAVLEASTAAIATQLIAGATLSMDVTVRNAAQVTSIFAADELDYVVTANNDGAITHRTGTRNATAVAVIESIPLDTTSPGARTVNTTIHTSSLGAANPTVSDSHSYAVLAHATPSLRPDVTQTAGVLDLGVVALGSRFDAGVGLFNLADVSGFTAGLDIDSAVLSGSPIVSLEGFTPISNLAAGDFATIELAASPDMTGMFEALLLLATSDQNLPGATSRDSLEIAITVIGAHAGDADLSNTVTFDDLLVLAQHYGRTSGEIWQTGDFNRDGAVGFDDLLALAQNYGLGVGAVSEAQFAADWALAQSLVPEPLSIAVFAPLLLVRRQR